MKTAPSPPNPLTGQSEGQRTRLPAPHKTRRGVRQGPPETPMARKRQVKESRPDAQGRLRGGQDEEPAEDPDSRTAPEPSKTVQKVNTA